VFLIFFQWNRLFLHYQNRVLCRVSKTLGKGYFTLGKAFAECNTRQIFYRQKVLCRVLFSDTRQRLCQVSNNTRQRKALGKLRKSKKIKQTEKHFLIIGTTLQLYLAYNLYITLPITISFFPIIFKSNLHVL
jgi:hypothetical protein